MNLVHQSMGIPDVNSFHKTGFYASKPHLKKCETEPPEIPPRMKKDGPELPEKPAHLRLASLTTKISKPLDHESPTSRLLSSQQNQSGITTSILHKKSSDIRSVPHFKSNPSNDQKLFLDILRKKSASANREILVAATKGAKDRPAEKRQREPAKLLKPLSNPPEPEDTAVHDDPLPVLLGLSSPKPRRKSNHVAPNTSVSKLEPYKPLSLGNGNPKFGKTRAPVILIPRSQLDTRSLHHIWNSYPMSYSLWVQNSGSGDPQVAPRLLRRSLSPNSLILRHGQEKSGKSGAVRSEDHPLGTRIFIHGKNSSPASCTSVKPRSSSVTRSGSLTSHGSTSSESGNETFPKSVLKKHKRETCSSSSETSKKSNEHKKNVTFNAFATVQLMEE